MRRIIILFVAIAISMVMSVSSYADEKNSTSVSKLSVQSAQKPKYQLRSKPITTDDSSDFKSNRDIKNEFQDNGNETITDHATGLMWQKSGSDNYMKYDDTKAYIDRLNREKFARYCDWRLPTVDELKSLLMLEKQSNGLYINPIFDKKQWWCWASDQRASGGAWNVIFNEDFVYWSKDGNFYVRAVRSLR